VDSQPLPFQQRAMDKLMGYISSAPTPLPVGLNAEWGMGKSTVIDCLLDKMNTLDADRFVAVKLNVWEYEDYGDLQYGAMQAIMAHPKSLEGYGWLAYPLWMLAREWGGLRIRSIRIGWGQSNADADGKLHLPWQSRFERIVARLHLGGRRVVFVLDEMDRASAIATQSALTLISRSLALPGVVIVVAHVENVIRFKALHPGVVVLDDLRDSVSGYLHQRWVDAQKSGHTPMSPNDPRRAYTPGADASFVTLTDAFMRSATPIDWRDYYSSLTERYLRQSVHLGRPDGDDLVAFLSRSEIAFLFADFGEARYQGMLAWVKAQTRNGNPIFQRIEMRVRWLKGDLLKLLSVPIPENLDPRFCLMLALSRGGAKLQSTEYGDA